MSERRETSAGTIETVIARAVRELDLAAKVTLLTGAAAFALHGES